MAKRAGASAPNEERLRHVASSLLRVQDEERRRVARELHDGFNQRLAVLAIQVAALEASLPDTLGEDVRSALCTVEAGLRELSDEVHELARRLHPSMVELLGLTPALESLCARVSREGGMKVRFSHRRIPRSIPTEIALCLYRVAQEALGNAAKHSGASQAKVRLVGSDGTVGLSVSDEGAGFDPVGAQRRSGLGLVIMEERVRLAGGTLAVRSEPGKGTGVHAMIRLPDQD